MDAQTSIIINIERYSSKVPVFITEESYETKPQNYLASYIPFQNSNYFCNIHKSIFSNNNSKLDYSLAKRFLMSRIFIQLDSDPTRAIPKLLSISQTPHPLVILVSVLSPFRLSYACLSLTMQILDENQEGELDRWSEEILKDCLTDDEILARHHTIAADFPQGVSNSVRAKRTISTLQSDIFLQTKKLTTLTRRTHPCFKLSAMFWCRLYLGVWKLLSSSALWVSVVSIF